MSNHRRSFHFGGNRIRENGRRSSCGISEVLIGTFQVSLFQIPCCAFGLCVEGDGREIFRAGGGREASTAEPGGCLGRDALLGACLKSTQSALKQACPARSCIPRPGLCRGSRRRGTKESLGNASSCC